MRTKVPRLRRELALSKSLFDERMKLAIFCKIAFLRSTNKVVKNFPLADGTDVWWCVFSHHSCDFGVGGAPQGHIQILSHSPTVGDFNNGIKVPGWSRYERLDCITMVTKAARFHSSVVIDGHAHCRQSSEFTFV